MATPYSVPLSRMFLHVVYEHRHFAAAAAAFRVWALDNSGRRTSPANQYVPDCWVAVRTAFLAHARNLASFYCDERPHATPKNLKYFDLYITDFEFARLSGSAPNEISDSISVHVGHITAWRDLYFHTTNVKNTFGRKPPSLGESRQWVDWDARTEDIISAVDAALEHAADPEASTQENEWWRAFQALHRACRERVDAPTRPWPVELDRPNLDGYLDSLGLS